jgi:tetratricopeptide (TPR) repeat protein
LTTNEEIQRLVTAAQDATRREAHDEAAEHYLELSELAPVAAVFNNLGLALMRDGRPEDAVMALAESVAREPSSAAYVNLGNAHRRRGDKAAAVDAYRRAVALDPDSAAAHYNMHAVLYSQSDPDPAIRSLERALALRPDHFDTRFYLGALRTLHDRDGDSIVEALPDVCDFLVTSLRYVQSKRTPETRLFSDTFDTLRFAVASARVEGPIVELGVRRGTTLRFLADLASPAQVHGFDAFEGLPETWGDQARGLYSTGGELPEVPANATLHPGWFADTVPPFARGLDGRRLRLVHIDCDIYGSTKDALSALAPSLGEGSVIVFDEYLCNPGWEREEHLAFTEIGLSYSYLAFSLFTKQAVVRIA